MKSLNQHPVLLRIKPEAPPTWAWAGVTVMRCVAGHRFWRHQAGAVRGCVADWDPPMLPDSPHAAYPVNL